MNSTIRVMTLLALASAVSGAQSGRPPVPPVAPTPPAPATPPMRVRIDGDMAARVREASVEMERMARDASRDAVSLSREMSQQAMEASRHALESARQSLENMRLDVRLDVRLDDLLSEFRSGSSFSGPRFQEDPADSLYNRARSLLNNTDYRAAAQRFKEVQQKYPNSRYIPYAMYYQAFALYRVGGDAELKEALAVLDAQQKQFPNAMVSSSSGRGVGVGRGLTIGRGSSYSSSASPTDVPALQMRIRSAQAARGDASARRQLDQAAGDTTCDREEQSVQAEALSGLMRIDPAAASGHLDKILAKRDKCSTSLRQTALQILGRNGDEKSLATLIATAKSDPSANLRVTAIEYMSRSQSDEVVSTLESLARNEQNESVRRAAARNLVGYSSNRARQAVRSLIEDNTVPDDIRNEMLGRFNSDRGTTEDAAWLRAAFTKVTSSSVKREIAGAVGRIGGQDSQKWLIDLSTNDQESATIRGEAFRSVSKSMTVAELSKAYDNAGSRQSREAIVRALNSRKEPEALDKLIEVVKKGTDPEIRRQVIGMLTDRKDPKITALLLELIDR